MKPKSGMTLTRTAKMTVYVVIVEGYHDYQYSPCSSRYVSNVFKSEEEAEQFAKDKKKIALLYGKGFYAHVEARELI